jgi:hypothetical protein
MRGRPRLGDTVGDHDRAVTSSLPPVLSFSAAVGGTLRKARAMAARSVPVGGNHFPLAAAGVVLRGFGGAALQDLATRATLRLRR